MTRYDLGGPSLKNLNNSTFKDDTSVSQEERGFVRFWLIFLRARIYVLIEDLLIVYANFDLLHYQES